MTARASLPSLLALVAALGGCTTDYDIKGVYGEEGGGEAAEADTGGAADTGAAADTGGAEQERQDGEDGVPGVGPGGGEEVDRDTGAADPGGAPEEGSDTAEDPAPEDDCDHTSDLIYVIARDDGALYTFDPESLSFTRLGALRCGSSATPESMSVARDGYAYVRGSDDAVYAVDLETLGCEATSYSDRATGFGSFGMGYATDDGDTWRDRLYVANERTLARLDTDTWELSTIGRMPSQSELTGDAAGELWAFLPLESPAALVRLDKEDASALEEIALPRFPDAADIDTFAFATWGGEHWLFVREYGMGSSTDVYEVRADGEMTKVLDDVGFDVVGAGVSTCAPTE